MLTKDQIIREVLSNVRMALYAKLTKATYSEYVKGSVTFRVDVIPGPEKHVTFLDLPSKTANPLIIEFKRRYTRRQAFPIEVSDADKD
jgi:hypothetical protein